MKILKSFWEWLNEEEPEFSNHMEDEEAIQYYLNFEENKIIMSVMNNEKRKTKDRKSKWRFT